MYNCTQSREQRTFENGTLPFSCNPVFSSRTNLLSKLDIIRFVSLLTSTVDNYVMAIKFGGLLLSFSRQPVKLLSFIFLQRVPLVYSSLKSILEVIQKKKTLRLCILKLHVAQNTRTSLTFLRKSLGPQHFEFKFDHVQFNIQ